MKTVGVLLASMICASSAMAQTPDWKTTWDETLAGAKKEGKVVIIGNPDPVMRKEIIPKFTARYGVPIEFIAGSSSQLVEKVRIERSSGMYSVDIYLSNAGTTLSVLYPQKMLDPIKPMLILPEVTDGSKWKRGSPWFADREGEYVMTLFYSVNVLLFINTDYVKPEEMRNVQDLLNPKWRGKIATEDPTASIGGSGNGGASRFMAQFGPEFVKKLYIDQKAMFSRDKRQIADWLARGTHPICLTCDLVDVQALRQDGFKLQEIFKLEGMKNSLYPSPFLLSAANKAPHPNAARVFVNWIATREALEIYSRASGAATLRNDVDESFLNPNVIPKEGVEYHDDTNPDWVEKERRETGKKVIELLRN